MELDVLNPLLKSGLINEETRSAINEAWEAKLADIKNTARTEIREEFANRYEHDKKTMVETLDKMVNEILGKEISTIKEERNQVAKLKIKTVNEMRGAAGKFNTFATRALAEELAEFAQERRLAESHKNKLEAFVMSSLAEEINEFAEDKKNLAETKVKLISEAKGELEKLKQKFIERASKAVSKIVTETLNNEITQLHGDLVNARKNNFGRQIFEAFAAEFSNTYLNKNTEMRNLHNKIVESKKIINKKNRLLEHTQHELTALAKKTERNKIVSELLTPLVKDKREVMSQLLENIQTEQLRSAYNKYLPAVLNNKQQLHTDGKIRLNEATGNRKFNKIILTNNPLNEINELKQLAGLTNK